MKQRGVLKAKSRKYLVNTIQLLVKYIIECSLDLGNRGLVLLEFQPLITPFPNLRHC